MAEMVEVILIQAFLFKREQLAGSHPLSRSMDVVSDHRQHAGLDPDLRLGGPGRCFCFRSGEVAVPRHCSVFPDCGFSFIGYG